MPGWPRMDGLAYRPSGWMGWLASWLCLLATWSCKVQSLNLLSRFGCLIVCKLKQRADQAISQERLFDGNAHLTECAELACWHPSMPQMPLAPERCQQRLCPAHGSHITCLKSDTGWKHNIYVVHGLSVVFQKGAERAHCCTMLKNKS